MSAMVSERPSLTHEFCGGLVETARAGLPAAMRDHALSHIGNALALAVAAIRHPGIDAIVRLDECVGGSPTTPLPARPEVLDSQHAAMAIAYAAHVDDFDDTHLLTVIHPSAATLGALYPLALELGASGQRVVEAFAVGCEAQLRVGTAMSPEHYDAGWHITGTCGVIGAAVAAGLLLDLEPAALAQAVGIAASCTIGQREGFGTMLKAFHPGKAAANGLLAARLAAAGFTASDRVLEAPRGFFAVLSSASRPQSLLDGLGGRWEFADDTVKAYPCGVVIHPLIDAGIELHRQIEDVQAVTEVEVRCHPLVVDLTGIREPTDGLEARFSAVHAIAAALVDGFVGIPSFDRRVGDPDVATVRRRIRLVPDASIARDETRARAVLDDGRVLDAHVEHCLGSLQRPLDADQLAAKIRRLVGRVLRDGADPLLAAVADLPLARDLGPLVRATSLGEGR